MFSLGSVSVGARVFPRGEKYTAVVKVEKKDGVDEMEKGAAPISGATYSLFVGSLFVFNLIVGTGSLTMPKPFAETGLLPGTLIILIIGFMG